MKSKALVIYILVCLFCPPGFAQTSDTVKLKEDISIDSSYIKHYDNYLNFTTGWNTRNTKYIVSYPQYGIRFVLSPKETHQFFFSLDYSFLYAYYSFTPYIFNLNREDTIKGSSKRSTFGMGFSVKQWHFNFDHQNIKGYYLHNTEEFIPGWSKGDAYIQFPDLRTVQTGLQVAYNFNEKFSVASLTSGKEQQLRTAVSFFPILAYWHIKIRDETVDSLQKSSNGFTVNNDINLLLPASLNIVFAKNFYAAAFAGPLIGIDFFKANGFDENGNSLITSGTKISTGYYARASVGYTGEKFFGGIDAFARNYGHGQQNQKFSKYSYGVQVYAGMRFNPPGFLQRTVTCIQNKRMR